MYVLLHGYEIRPFGCLCRFKVGLITIPVDCHLFIIASTKQQYSFPKLLQNIFRADRDTTQHKKVSNHHANLPLEMYSLHCNHLGNTWKPLVLMTRHFDYCPSASEDDNQSVRSSAPVVSRCFPGGYNVKLYISRGRLAWWLLFFLHSASTCKVIAASALPTYGWH